MNEKDQLRVRWLTQFRQAQQADSWGQVVEASDEYQTMAAVIAAKQGLHLITSMEKDTMHRLVLCLSARIQTLQTMEETITSTDMKLLEPVFESLFTGNEPKVFPIEPSKFQRAQPVTPSTGGEIVCGDGDEAHSSDWHLSQAALRSVTGTVVAIRIEKIGLKDAQDYIDPFMTILVADPRTTLLDSHQTPIAKERGARQLMFNHQVYLKRSFEDMHLHNAALFFEFKHYKPKKKKTSTRCWCFMELNELKQDEEIVLEIYHKPTDLRKRRLKLHSEKALYLHLYATFIHA
eukprot:NODE_6218_length_1692_cov_10.115655.p1 GENE.NODE_6218_length_1692_cov_10.115655~~NODE_6218_length_1692_cov_10.115655.p1  ORF type:complete len:291 (+),score=55.35 NODE_6218_length_1692_cov_10.115655:62-934(+)